jgi:hypothetical protein
VYQSSRAIAGASTTIGPFTGHFLKGVSADENENENEKLAQWPILMPIHLATTRYDGPHGSPYQRQPTPHSGQGVRVLLSAAFHRGIRRRQHNSQNKRSFAPSDSTNRRFFGASPQSCVAIPRKFCNKKSTFTAIAKRFRRSTPSAFIRQPRASSPEKPVAFERLPMNPHNDAVPFDKTQAFCT